MDSFGLGSITVHVVHVFNLKRIHAVLIVVCGTWCLFFFHKNWLFNIYTSVQVLLSSPITIYERICTILNVNSLLFSLHVHALHSEIHNSIVSRYDVKFRIWSHLKVKIQISATVYISKLMSRQYSYHSYLFTSLVYKKFVSRKKTKGRQFRFGTKNGTHNIRHHLFLFCHSWLSSKLEIIFCETSTRKI